MIQFFGSIIKYFVYLKLCVYANSNDIRRQSRTFYYQWPGFYHTLLLVKLCGIFWFRYFYFVDKLLWNLIKELNNFKFFLHKMTGQRLKLGKFMTDQVANTFGHVWWPSVISTPVLNLYGKPVFNAKMKKIDLLYEKNLNVRTLLVFKPLSLWPFHCWVLFLSVSYQVSNVSKGIFPLCRPWQNVWWVINFSTVHCLN